MPVTPRREAERKARELECIARTHGTRRTIASDLVAHFAKYGIPPRERAKNIHRAFVWEMTGEREQLVRLLTACYRAAPERLPRVPEEEMRTY